VSALAGCAAYRRACGRTVSPASSSPSNHRSHLDERSLFADVDPRAFAYVAAVATRRVFPDADTLALLDTIGLLARSRRTGRASTAS
jgi:hypothetical protein